MTIATQTDVREHAAARFEALGWPTTELEEWKYTNVAPIAKTRWRVAEGGGAPHRDASLREHALAELIFVNGRFLEATGSAAGIEILPIRKAQAHPAFERHYARYADYQRHALTALNTANAQDGALVVVPDGKAVAGFIHLLFIGSGSEIWSHPRNLIVVGRGSQVAVVESFV